MKGLQALLIASCVLLAAPAAADETLKLTVGQRAQPLLMLRGAGEQRPERLEFHRSWLVQQPAHDARYRHARTTSRHRRGVPAAAC